jgi:hypothetical protein
MANAMMKSAAEGVTFKLSRLAPRFDGGGLQDLRWRCQECNLDLGPNPSEAVLVLSKTAGSVTERANSMAFNHRNTSWLRFGTRCVVEKHFPNDSGGFAKQTVFVGSVTMVRHDRDKNALVVVLHDDRWLLRNIRVIGRWIIDPNQTGGPFFQQGWGAHFNPGGRPNCIYADVAGDGNDAGFLPFFTPYPDYGLIDGQDPPEPNKRDVTVASYWTMGSILEYLRTVYSATGIAGSSPKFQWIAKAPDTLVWPKEFANAVDAQAVANFDSGAGQTNQNKGGARKGREVVLEGVSLLDAISMLLSTAGGYDIAFAPHVSTGADGAETFKNILSIKPTRFLSAQNGVSIPMALDGKAQDALSRAAITGGSFEENAFDYASSVAGAGQLVFIERLLSTKTEDGASLRPSWNRSSRFDLFRKLAAGRSIQLNGQEVESVTPGVCFSPSIAQALRVFPDMLTTWCLNESFDFQAGTSESEYPRAPIKRTPWPTLLSVLGDAGGFDFAGMHCPVYVEVEETPGNWALVGQFDSFEIFDNGNIYLPLMREETSAHRVWKFSGTPYAVTNDMIDIEVRNIRLALAIPCDHRLSYSVFGIGDGQKSGDGSEFYFENPDIDRVSASLKRRDYRDLQELYACWLRKDSYSRPKTQKWKQDENRPNRSPASEALRSDLETLKAHIRKAMSEVNRLAKGGNPRIDGYLVTTYAPGTPVKDFKPVGANTGMVPFPVNAVTSGYRLCCEEDKVYTELKFMGAQNG